MALIGIDTLKKAVSEANTAKGSYSASAVTNSNGNSINYAYSNNLYDDMYKTTTSPYSNAYDTAFNLQKNGNGLFDRRVLDSIHEVDNLTKYWQMSSEELDAKKDQGNGVWTVDMREDTNGDGKVDNDDELVTKSLVDAIVDSYDSELDLYIENKLQEVIETYGPSCTYNLRAIFGSPDSQAVKELAKLGIRADGIGDHDNWQNRTYTFSLVDMSGLSEDATDEEIMAYVYSDDAEILQDAAGNKGSIIFADCLTADGTAQGAEMNLSSILDQMGYECVSKADFLGKEQDYNDLLSNIQAGLDNNLYASSGDTIQTKYGETLTIMQAVCAVYDINGDAPGQWRIKGRTYEQTKSAVDRLGDSLYKGGRAQKGAAVNYGITDVYNNMSSLSEIESLTSELDKNLNDMDNEKLSEQERKEAEQKAKKIKKQIEQKAQNLTKEEKSALQDKLNKQQESFNKALNEAQKALNVAVENKEDSKAIVEQIAKEYEVDFNELLKEIKM